MMMRKNRGMRLGRRLVKVFQWWVNGRSRSRAAYKRLSRSGCAARAMSKIFSWGHSLKNTVKGLPFLTKNSGYIRLGSDSGEERRVSGSGHLPKGHLAVYVGDKEDDTCRVLVPVIYFNHPLFADLLREAEMVYGFNHEGGIQIPCQKAQFENVKMRIAATSGGARCRRRWSCIKGSTTKVSKYDDAVDKHCWDTILYSAENMKDDSNIEITMSSSHFLNG